MNCKNKQTNKKSKKQTKPSVVFFFSFLFLKCMYYINRFCICSTHALGFKTKSCYYLQYWQLYLIMFRAKGFLCLCSVFVSWINKRCANVRPKNLLSLFFFFLVDNLLLQFFFSMYFSFAQNHWAHRQNGVTHNLIEVRLPVWLVFCSFPFVFNFFFL